MPNRFPARIRIAFIRRFRAALFLLAIGAAGGAPSGWADGPRRSTPKPPAPKAVAEKGPSMLSPMAPGLTLPLANPARGRRLFAAKGCVICHSVNGVGGTVGPNLDVTTSYPYASPFDFSARMWRGAKSMIALQEKQLGYVLSLDGNELADITAFAHNAREQRKFSEDEIPAPIKRLMNTRGL